MFEDKNSILHAFDITIELFSIAAELCSIAALQTSLQQQNSNNAMQREFWPAVLLNSEHCA